MTEREYNEYSRCVGNRDYWSRERGTCVQKMRDLHTKVERLQDCCQRLVHCAEEVCEIMFRVEELPHSCSGWKGSRANRCFDPCMNGALHEACMDYSGEIDDLLQQLEICIDQLEIQLEEAQLQYNHAEYYYNMWDDRAACFC